jgi:diguanylate cyclase (GGDEF)-like protein
MVRESRTRSRHGLAPVKDWAVWSLPRRPRFYILAVVCAYLACFAATAWNFTFRLDNVIIFAALLACGAATVELTRREGERSGVSKDVYAVWELPVVILLPPLYALVFPAVRVALTQWRVRRAPAYRRVFTVAAIGLAYGGAWLVFHGIVPGTDAQRDFLWNNTGLWLVAAVACAVTQVVVNQTLVLTAARTVDPSTPVLASAFSKEALHNDATELCGALLVALGLTVSAFTLIIALPLATLLQRSFRHEQLLHEARADSKTGLLNAATWEREAAAEVSRAVRTGSPLAVAILDLDRFKQINDNYGHLLGDTVLRDIADTMTRSLRDYDLAGRFGGEEFVMLLPQTRAVDALRIAERLRAHIAQLPVYADGSGGSSSNGARSADAGPVGAASVAAVAGPDASRQGRTSGGAPGDGERVPVTVSIGVAALDAGSRRELPELLAAADAALYRAKASGRDQVQMISTSRGLSAVRPPAKDPRPTAPAPAPAAAAAAATDGGAPEMETTASPGAAPFSGGKGPLDGTAGPNKPGTDEETARRLLLKHSLTRLAA